MAKRFKLRLCSLFSSCRSKDHLPSLPLRSSSLFRRRSPSPEKDANCQDDGDTLALPASPYSTSSDAFVPPQLSPLLRAGKHGQPSRRSRTRKKKRPMRTSTMHRPRVSTSSANSCLFSSEEGLETETEREMETLVSHSSRSFYTDSSSPHLETIREGPIITGRKKRSHAPKRSVLNNRATAGGGQERLSDVGGRGSWSDGEGAPARLSAVLQRLMRCAAVEVEGKVRESFAVVKRSDDPYEDFRRSMAEMIAEKEMVEEEELQELLRCFLSLNSEHHHGIIITAFHDISNAFFSNSNST